MRYADGTEAQIGDAVAIAERHRGTVVANIDGREFSERYPKEDWEHLNRGILVETDFAGLVHYPNGDNERIRLIERGK